MAAAGTKTFIAIVILSLIGQGLVAAKYDCFYTAEDIKVSQKPTGVVIEGSPEYELTFITHAAVPTPIVGNVGDSLTPRGDGTCLLTDGSKPIRGYATIKVKYAWKTPVTIKPILSQVDCRS
ncbi:hypothetical protein MKW92_023836 [Papaver armeniacum]|nr:hypothetical protein MKW92_023836 [Papaver armeniacum]